MDYPLLCILFPNVERDGIMNLFNVDFYFAYLAELIYGLDDDDIGMYSMGGEL